MGANSNGGNKGWKQRNGGQNKGKQNNEKQNNEKQSPEQQLDIRAPYNFVPFSEHVYHYPKRKLTKHNDMSEELVSGEISYEVTARKPIFIGDGRKDAQDTKLELFHRNERKEYCIPGSTMRGLIRTNVQILGLSAMGDDVDDYALMYRAVASGMEKKRYAEILGVRQISSGANVLSKVKAGYIREEGGKYFIRTVAEQYSLGEGEDKCSMNYYVLSERKVLENQKAFPYFTNNPEERMMYNLNCRFRKKGSGKGTQYVPADKKTMVNQDYRPYYEEVSYETMGNDVSKVGETGQFSERGYVLSSGDMYGKKAVYIIPGAEKDEKKDECISDDDIRAFRIDLSKRENTLKDKGGKEFFDLPAKGETKPIFYVKYKENLYFGFTPSLRLFYDYTIKEGMDKKHKADKVDYAKAIFGYSKEESAYKSKVSFSDAVVSEAKEAVESGKKEAILLEPKPTSYMDYLTDEQNNPTTYNNKGFKLRGAKQYWLKEKVDDMGEVGPENVLTKFIPLKEGVRFVGKVRFQNLTPDELGLLLWSIRLNKDSQMNVGKGKPYGYGKIKVELKEVRILDLRRAYCKAGGLDLDPFRRLKPEEIEDYILQYKDIINSWLPKGKTIDELSHIQEFFLIKDATCIPDESKTRYMSLEEYRARVKEKKPLPLIKQVVEKNKH